MTAPTPPPGWHQDPGDANLLRYWDGTQWTEQTQPKPSQSPPPRKKGGVGKVLLILAGVLVVMGILGAVFGGGDKKDDKPEAAAASSTATTPQVTTTRPTTTSAAPSSTTPPAAAAPTTQAPAPAPRPAVPASDPRCAPANETLVALVESGFSASGLSLINGTVIDSGPYTFLGAVDGEDAVLHVDVGDGGPVGVLSVADVDEDFVGIVAGEPAGCGATVSDGDAGAAEGVDRAGSVVDALVDVDQ